VALEAGADDVATSDGIIEVLCQPNDFEKVLAALEKAGFTQESAEITMNADVKVTLDKDTTQKVLKIINLLEDNDDVQNVWSNLEIPDDMDLDA
jgi:transcriptional/translational regulatory protein YebC/TACO1